MYIDSVSIIYRVTYLKAYQRSLRQLNIKPLAVGDDEASKNYDSALSSISHELNFIYPHCTI